MNFLIGFTVNFLRLAEQGSHVMRRYWSASIGEKNAVGKRNHFPNNIISLAYKRSN